MSEETYEFQCMRAELLGLEKPSLEEFERNRAERLKQQQEELDAAEAQLLEEQDETLNNTGGKLDELNTILSSTQQKLNRFKQTACTSLSNIFSRSGSLQTETVNPGKEESETNPSTSGANTRRNTTACTSNINPTLNITDQGDNQMLEPERQHQPGEPVIPIEKIRAAKDDVQKKMTSHLHKLDSLINKADQAEISMAEQTKQMRKMTKYAKDGLEMLQNAVNMEASIRKSDVKLEKATILKPRQESCSSAVTQEKLDKWRKNFYEEPKNVLAQNVCSRFDPFDVCLSRKTIESINHVFTYKVEMEGKPVTNQKNSGRCWLFAALNCIRLPFMKEYNLDEFEFSQSYLFYWDKIERCNYFLNNIVNTSRRGEKVDGRLVSFLLTDPTSDGGQWDMLVNLITKHGLMPKKSFPESFTSEASQHMNAVLRSKLREYAKVLRNLMDTNPSDEEINAKIDDIMAEIYKVVGICLGIPAEKFTWEYYDKAKAYHSVGPIKPVEFYNTMVKPIFNVEDKVCLVTDPRLSNPYSQAYTVDCLGNVIGGRPVLYNNQPVELLLNMVTASLKAGEAVWFGCEVSKRFAPKQGIEDLNIHDFKLVFDVDIQKTLCKADRLIYGESSMTHAMLFTAVSLDENGFPKKLRVENSWGEERGEKGYLVMTADWFKDFGFEVVVDKKFVPEDVMRVFEMDPIVLPAWDPMGTLAQ